MKNLNNMMEYLEIILFKAIGLDSFFRLKKGGYLETSGWLKSFSKGIPIDNNNNPIPWLTYSSIAFIDRKINKEMTIFEYGCGNSTLWWADRVGKVISCEHDREWYNTMKQRVPPNVELHYTELRYGGDYSRKVSEYIGIFDIVVIDGRDRINCSKNCMMSLKKTGVIIWDNSDRDCYKEGFNYLLNCGLKKIDFEGMGPVNPYSWTTTIFYKEDNCLGI